jgi:hypothetical protein
VRDVNVLGQSEFAQLRLAALLADDERLRPVVFEISFQDVTAEIAGITRRGFRS